MDQHQSKCGTRMNVIRMEPGELGSELRTFECSSCNEVMSIAVASPQIVNNSANKVAHPTCPSCGHGMNLTKTAPDELGTNVEKLRFTCPMCTYTEILNFHPRSSHRRPSQ
jgi:hypothetical protein